VRRVRRALISSGQQRFLYVKKAALGCAPRA
jgi:hypothetical protein